MSKNILILSHSTFPSNHPRALRTDELARELARQGNNVTLYVLTSTFNYSDFERDTNITVKSLGKIYLSKYSHEAGKLLNFPAKVFNKLLGKYTEFPDIELIRNVYSALFSELNNENEIDLLITIAVPHPIHWGAALFKTKNIEKFKNITWVADCGDPYMGNPFTSPPFYFRYVENWLCKHADYITVPVKEAINIYPCKFRDKLKVIPQGFNLEDISFTDYVPKHIVPTFIYAGSFYPKYRDPSELLDYLSSLNKDFKFIIYTKNHSLVKPYLKKMGSKLIVRPYLTRNELLKEMKGVDFLINLENPSAVQSPSKLIDYAISGRPVLSINSNTILNTHKIDDFLEGNYSNALSTIDIKQYDIKNIAISFLSLIS